MTKKDLISRIKLQLKELIQPELQKFAEVKAGDLILTTPAESFEVGAEIFYVDSDGNNAPLNEGEYTLDNGTKIMVAGGKIMGIFEPESEVEPEEMVKEEKPMTEEEKKKEEKMESGIDMVEFGQMKERLAKCEKMIEKMMEEKGYMEKKMAELSALPAESPIQKNPAPNQPVSVRKDGITSEEILSIRERARAGARK